MMVLRVFFFMLILTLTNCLICSDEGYNDYLKQYPFKEGLSTDYVKYDVSWFFQY